MLGAAGFPLFQGNYYSPAYLLGPTGGYLIGFIFAAWFIGHILDADTPGILKTATSFIIGCIIIYAFGIIWLIYLYRMTLIKAISIGALPFIPGDAVKISLAVIIYSSLAKRARAVFPRCQ
jgi:biotin transport system substrate-specific component